MPISVCAPSRALPCLLDRRPYLEPLTVERPRKRRLRFLDDPYLSVQLDLERLQRDLRILASRTGSPLPKRLRSQLGQMARQLGRLRREIRDHHEAIEEERLRDERRFRGR